MMNNRNDNNRVNQEPDANCGESDAHPVGTGVGAATGQVMTFAAELHLRSDYYKRQYGQSRLGWDKAQYATRDAWDQIE